jgi:hypothetical protein
MKNHSSSNPFGIILGPFGTGYVIGMGSGSTSPKYRLIGGRPTRKTGPREPITIE